MFCTLYISTFIIITIIITVIIVIPIHLAYKQNANLLIFLKSQRLYLEARLRHFINNIQPIKTTLLQAWTGP